MELAGLLVTVVATLIAAGSAWVAWKQRKDAQDAAGEARADAEQAIEAAKRAAVAQESIAAGHDEDRRRAVESQAKKVRMVARRQGPNRGRVKITNASTEPIFDVQVHSISAMVGDAETEVAWQPNPHMTPSIRVISLIPGQQEGRLYVFFDEDFGDHPWSVIVRFLDANRVLWEINLANEVARVDG